MRHISERLTGRGSPFELVEGRVGENPCRIFRHGPQTLRDVYRRAQASGPRCYVVCDSGGAGTRITYEETFRAARVLARILSQRFGISAGRRVGIALGNCPQWALSLIATTNVGGTAVALRSDHSPKELAESLDVSECSAIITDRPTAQNLFDVGDRRPTIVVDSGSEWMESGEIPGVAPTRLPSIDPDQEALIAFTSGTTSRPKGVVLTHRGLTTGMMNMMLGGAIGADGNARRRADASPDALTVQATTLIATPFSHASGYFSLLLMAYLGGKVVALPPWSTPAALALIRRESVRSLVGVTPAIMRELLESDPTCATLRQLSTIILQGAALHPRVFNEIAQALPDVAVGTGYGMTETNGSVCVASAADLIRRPTTGGRPLPTVELRLVDEDGQQSSGTGSGEIWLRGAMLMRGYCRAGGEVTGLLPGGWFRTGDLGRVDEDGFLHVTGRRSEIIMCRGQQVSANQVEDALLDHPAVMEAVAVGVDREPYDQRLLVAYVPRAGYECAEPELASYLGGRVALGQITARIRRLDSLPRTASGKINRQAIRERLLADSLQERQCR